MKFNVLIVDDEKNIRAGLGKAIEMDGHNVILAEDGQQAMDIVESDEVDLVIADLRMPKLSGEELLRQIVQAYPTLPVIILTGHGTIETAVKALRIGAHDFLEKPLAIDYLMGLKDKTIFS
mgnify:CR=1 FL=1